VFLIFTGVVAASCDRAELEAKTPQTPKTSRENSRVTGVKRTAPRAVNISQADNGGFGSNRASDLKTMRIAPKGGKFNGVRKSCSADLLKTAAQNKVVRSFCPLQSAKSGYRAALRLSLSSCVRLLQENVFRERRRRRQTDRTACCPYERDHVHVSP
jgi:hypothetical protein